jgi:hypothetical protein
MGVEQARDILWFFPAFGQQWTVGSATASYLTEIAVAQWRSRAAA